MRLMRSSPPSGNFSTGMSYLDQVTKYLASNDPLKMPEISSDYRTAMEQMFDDLGSISAGLSRLSVETASYSAQIISDMKAVNDQFNVVMMRVRPSGACPEQGQERHHSGRLGGGACEYDRRQGL